MNHLWVLISKVDTLTFTWRDALQNWAFTAICLLIGLLSTLVLLNAPTPPDDLFINREEK
jgi:hypothetical protein